MSVPLQSESHRRISCVIVPHPTTSASNLNRPTLLAVPAPKFGSIRDLMKSCSDLCGIDSSRLAAAAIYRNRYRVWSVFKTYQHDEQLMNIRPEDRVHVFEVPSELDLQQIFGRLDLSEFVLASVTHLEWKHSPDSDECRRRFVGVPFVTRLPVGDDIDAAKVRWIIANMIEGYSDMSRFDSKAAALFWDEQDPSVVFSPYRVDQMNHSLCQTCWDQWCMGCFEHVRAQEEGKDEGDGEKDGEDTSDDDDEEDDSQLMVITKSDTQQVVFAVRWEIGAENCFDHACFEHPDGETQRELVWKYVDDNGMCVSYPLMVSARLDALEIAGEISYDVEGRSYTLRKESRNSGRQINIETKTVRAMVRKQDAQPRWRDSITTGFECDLLDDGSGWFRGKIMDDLGDLVVAHFVGRDTADDLYLPKSSSKIAEAYTKCPTVPTTAELITILNLDHIGSVPEFWNHFSTELLVSVHRTDMLFQKVKREFEVEGANFTDRYQVTGIEVVQSQHMFRKYQAYRQGVHLQAMNERFGWHGTTGDATDSIIQTGFKRDYSHKMRYGAGVYFAKYPSYSAHNRFSPPDASGTKHMFYCILLCGEWAKGDSSCKTPPLKPNHQEYESMVDCETDPTIFVAPHDHMAFPVALVRFKSTRPPVQDTSVSTSSSVSQSLPSQNTANLNGNGITQHQHSHTSLSVASSMESAGVSSLAGTVNEASTDEAEKNQNRCIIA